MNSFYLGVFVVYLFTILGIGVWGWRKVSDQSDFATADRGLSLAWVTGSLLATFISALSIVGGVGYASQYGWAFLSLFSFGAIAGCGFLSLTAEKWHSSGVNSISELLEERYGSKHLRSVTAAAVVFSFAVILIAQLFGIGFILEGIVGIPMPAAILAVGVIITVYTILGGMVSVARTDVIQVVIMGAGVLVLVVFLLRLVLTDPANYFTQNPGHMSIYGGASSTNLGVLGNFVAIGFGTAVQPYFVQRLLSAEGAETARLAPALAALGAFLIYISLCVVGIVGAIYLPEQVGDTMAPAVIQNLLPEFLGALALVALIAVVQSTTDSLLHVMGVYISQDIYGLYFVDDPADGHILKASRVFTGIFGFVCVGIATAQAAFGEIGLIALFATYAWGVIAASLFAVVTAAFFWRRATWQGGVAAVVSGFVVRVAGGVLEDLGVVGFDTTMVAVLASFVVMVAVSWTTYEEGVALLKVAYK